MPHCPAPPRALAPATPGPPGQRSPPGGPRRTGVRSPRGAARGPRGRSLEGNGRSSPVPNPWYRWIACPETKTSLFIRKPAAFGRTAGERRNQSRTQTRQPAVRHPATTPAGRPFSSRARAEARVSSADGGAEEGGALPVRRGRKSRPGAAPRRGIPAPGAEAKRGRCGCGTGGEQGLPVCAAYALSAVPCERMERPGRGSAAKRGSAARAGCRRDGERRIGRTLSRYNPLCLYFT